MAAEALRRLRRSLECSFEVLARADELYLDLARDGSALLDLVGERAQRCHDRVCGDVWVDGYDELAAASIDRPRIVAVEPERDPVNAAVREQCRVREREPLRLDGSNPGETRHQ